MKPHAATARAGTFWRCDPVPKERYCLVTEIAMSADGSACVSRVHRPCADCWAHRQHESLVDLRCHAAAALPQAEGLSPLSTLDN